MLHDINPAPSTALLETLADFRFELRQFLHFSEGAAEAAGLQPKQHQLLLQIAGAPQDTLPTIAYAARRLCLRHNSAVELVDRCVRDGWLRRAEDPNDRRRVLLQLTPQGERVLRKLSRDHARELHELAPRLVGALERIRTHADAPESDGQAQ